MTELDPVKAELMSGTFRYAGLGEAVRLGKSNSTGHSIPVLNVMLSVCCQLILLPKLLFLQIASDTTTVEALKHHGDCLC